MDFYLLIVFILLLFSIAKPAGSKARNLLLIAMLFFYALATLRGLDVGNDTRNYGYFFQGDVRGIRIYSNAEIGYQWLNRFIRLFTDNYNVFLAVINIIIYYAFYRLIRDYSSNYGMSLLLFLCFGFWGNTVNILRQELAVAMFIYVYLLTENGKRVRGAAVSLLAPLFQKTSIVFFLYYLVPKRINKRFFVVAGATGTIVLLVIDRMIYRFAGHFTRIRNYINSQYVIGRIEPSIAVTCAFLLAVVIWSLYIYNRYKEGISEDKRMKEIELQINMVFMAFLVMLVALKFNILDRCAIFFRLFDIILIPNIIGLIKKDEFRHFFQAAFTVVAIAYFVAVNVFRPEWNHIYPYRMFFQASIK